MEKKKSIEILHFTDIHGAGYLFQEIRESIGKADLIILSGDITHFGTVADARKIIENLARFNKHILAVSGNCDDLTIDTYLNKSNRGIHMKTVEFGNYLFTGISGSLPCPGRTPYEFTETEVASWLQQMSAQIIDDKSLIFVTHQPPFNTIADKIGYNVHVGSQSIREFIQNKKPVLCLTGHIHEGIGVDKIDDCPVVNPGPFRTGNYAHIRIDEYGSVEISLRQIRA